MRAALLSLALLASSCAGTCSAIGGGAIGSGAIGAGAIGSGAIGGTAAAAADDACGSPPGTPSLHYAARLETAYSNTDVVPTATDQGSLGVNATQAMGSAQPTFVADCINGLPCYSFDGGDTLLATIASQPAPFTLVAVFDKATTDAVNETVSGWTNAVLRVNSTSGAQFGAGTFATSTTVPSENTFHMFVGANSGTNVSASIDGEAASTAAVSIASTGTSFALGANAGGTNLLTGRIPEVITYGTAPTTADLKTYLECVYGASFPVSP